MMDKHFFQSLSPAKVVEFNPEIDIMAEINLSPDNPELTPNVVADTATFSKFIDQKLQENNSRYLVGGYGERREIYRRSTLFDDNVGAPQKDEPRNIHLGVDIWAAAGTPVYLPLEGNIHSFAYNGAFGDYGATIIVEHEFYGNHFFTLYGHLSKQDLIGIQPGEHVEKGSVIGHFGKPEDNGDWPPHLHFQVIRNIGDMKGDYPGVCKTSEKESYLENCPDPRWLMVWKW